MAAKKVTIGGDLNLRICMLLKSAVKNVLTKMFGPCLSSYKTTLVSYFIFMYLFSTALAV